MSHDLLGRFGEKLERATHDGYAAACAKLGPRLKVVTGESLHPEKMLVRKSGPSAWPADKTDAGGACEKRSKEIWLYRMRDAWVTGSEALMFCDPHTLVRLDEAQSGIELRKIRRPIPALARRRETPLLALGGRGVGNRGHFVCEHLPRVMMAREKLGPDACFDVLLTPGHAEWQAEYLRRLGEHHFVEGRRGTLFCRELWCIPHLSKGSAMELCEPDIYRRMAAMMKSNPVPAKFGPHLFITRNDASVRRLSNESEVFDLCRKFFPGLERIGMGALSPAEEIGLFARAKTVIGPLGQPFRVVLWCEGALTVQLSPGVASPANPFFSWARDCERLGSIHGNRSVSFFSDEAHEGGDWLMPLPKLEKSLEQLCRNAGARNSIGFNDNR